MPSANRKRPWLYVQCCLALAAQRLPLQPRGPGPGHACHGLRLRARDPRALEERRLSRDWPTLARLCFLLRNYTMPDQPCTWFGCVQPPGAQLGGRKGF